MPALHFLSFTIRSMVTLSTNSILFAFIAIFKIASLVPLLVRWNFPLLEIPRAKRSTWWEQESPKRRTKEIPEPIARVGRKCIVLREPRLIQKVLAVSQSHGEGSSPLQSEFCHVLEKAERKMQAALRQWTASLKKIDQGWTVDKPRPHPVQDKDTISEICASAKMNSWATGLVLTILDGPRVKHLLQEELMDSGIIHQAPQLVRDSVLRSLPFLQACVWEALRTHPPLHLLDAQLTTSDEISLWAYRIPAGTRVVFDYNACLNAACFGSSVHAFRPKRWMIDDLNKLMAMRRHVDVVWGKTPSHRLTVDIACMQLRKLIFNILYQA